MGNALKPQPNKFHSSSPTFNYNIQHLNLLFEQNAPDLGFVLQLNPNI